MKPEASPFKFSVILFRFPCHFLLCKFFNYTKTDLATYAQLPISNCAVQEVLSNKGADNKGSVSVWASDRSGRNVCLKGGKVRADMASGADGVLKFGKGDYILHPVIKGNFQLAFDVNTAYFHGLEGIFAF